MGLLSTTLFLLSTTLLSAVSASPQDSNDPCLVKFNQCLADNTPRIVCNCNLNACSQTTPYDDPFCQSATPSLLAPTSNSIPTTTPSSSPPTISPTTTTPTAPLVYPTLEGPSSAPKITAPAHSVPFGEECNAHDQCAEGVRCFGNTGETILTCGSFNAPCTDDSQCAYNLCVGRLCRGSLASESWLVNTVSRTSTSTSTSLVPSSTASEALTSTSTTFAVVVTPPPSSSSTPSSSSSSSAILVPTAPPTSFNITTLVPPPTFGPANPTAGIPTPTAGPAAPPPSTAPYTGEASLGATLSGLAALVAVVVAWAL